MPKFFIFHVQRMRPHEHQSSIQARRHRSSPGSLPFPSSLHKTSRVVVNICNYFKMRYSCRCRGCGWLRVAGCVVGFVTSLLLPVAALVGQQRTGVDGRFRMNVPINSWTTVERACLVGLPNNLVVDAMPTVDARGVQNMVVTGPSSRLCQWLADRIQSHNDQRGAWQKALLKEKSKYGWWRLWTRLALWQKEFPSPRIIATVTYFDFTDGDANPLATPWFSAIFTYELPPPADSFGVFDHLEGSFASFPGAAPKEVTLLLNPSSTFNMVLPEDRPNEPPDVSDVFNFLGYSSEQKEQTRAYFHIKFNDIGSTPVTFNLKLADFWSYGGDCIIKGNFLVTWSEYRTPCSLVHEVTNSMVTAYLADKVEAVKFIARGIDFFSNIVPGIEAVVDKPHLIGPDGKPVLDWSNKWVKLGFLSDPLLKKKFSRAKNFLSHIRAQMAIGLSEGILNPEKVF
ncbi:putative transmembrane protein [Toxoplasma gondii VAND]|uniref:Putative transmembrane protein n=1 Tax=Toxoplasma gondii VAND TaxID=933077 RepID=A0A086PTV9_TOXGO|nr:putative transmembrane protein [Toxoplasma gondii VAND]